MKTKYKIFIVFLIISIILIIVGQLKGNDFVKTFGCITLVITTLATFANIIADYFVKFYNEADEAEEQEYDEFIQRTLGEKM